MKGEKQTDENLHSCKAATTDLVQVMASYEKLSYMCPTFVWGC